jgi:DNA-binding IclR family transcriptional regulator
LCASGPSADTFLLGDNGPAYTSACGKILVAQRDEAEWLDYAPQPEDAVGSPYANRDPRRFVAELHAARLNGVAWCLRERDVNLCSVAAPLHVGELPWSRAVGIALPHNEWAVRDRNELAAEVRKLAAEISGRLHGKTLLPLTGAR